MRTLVLGASGGVGRWLAALAAENGHDVRAVVRESATYEPPPGVEVVRGDVTEPWVIEQAVRDRDIVLSALGLRRAGRNPGAQLLSPRDLTQRVMRHLVPSMQRHGVQRLVAVSAGGVGDSFAQLSWPVQRLVSAGNIAVAYQDLAEMERVLESSNLDWLAVRPVTLVSGSVTGRAREVDRYGLLSRVRRSDVAAWMLDALERPGAFSQRRVLLGS